MKRLVFIAMATSFVAIAAELTISDTSGPAGSIMQVDVTLKDPDRTITGIQFDLSWKDRAIELSASAGPVATAVDKDVSTGVIAPSRKRFLVIGMNRQQLQEGVIVHLIAKMHMSASGKYQLTISDVIATNADGRGVPCSGKSGTVMVGRRHPVRR
jgi:cohesin domain-containing protein